MAIMYSKIRIFYNNLVCFLFILLAKEYVIQTVNVMCSNAIIDNNNTYAFLAFVRIRL